ncbi:hypothetical protein O3M35_001549 [Rhynocoris fuscipes]|uniref:HMG box domain-containing protein n=1 Tax=Rhynocoris fuscipes TaxID=488301 RepID=A0AAW1CMX1_9HEMI
MPCRRRRSSRRSSCSRRPYYKKRRYLCCGKRRYKAIRRCCRNPQKITLCNRNWVRISVHPFINFLRCYKRKFSKHMPIADIAREGRRVWKRMSKTEKKPFFEQAKRARKRGFRT